MSFIQATRRIMPLRAKVLNRTLLNMSTTSSSSTPANEEAPALFEAKNGTRTVILNRPKKLNSLNQEMCKLITPKLNEWAEDKDVHTIILKGAGEKALCAGGDIAALAVAITEKGPEGAKEGAEYFRDEYTLDHIIATFPKPYVSLMDGITMGGGVGLSVHAPFRIATEKTLFAMPETNIGFWPDVGGAFFLSRMDGKTGLYLGTTSDRLKGYDVFLSGIASHYVPSNRLPELESKLADLNPSAENNKSIYDLVNETIEEFSQEVPSDHIYSLGGEKGEIIDEAFGKNTIEEVLQALENNGSEFALKTKATLLERCPTSVKVAFEAIRNGRSLDISTAFVNDFYMAENFLHNPNFAEGVTALLLTKPSRKANWVPSKLEDVDKKTVQGFLIRRGPEATRAADFVLDSSANYSEYPHNKYRLPSEEAIKDYVVGNVSGRDFKATRKEVVDYFISATNGKVSVEYRVNEVLDRRTKPDSSDPTLLDWKY